MNKELKQVCEQTKEMKLKDILKNVNEWANKLSEYAYRNRNEILLQKAFLSNFQYDKLINAIKNSSNSQISTFRGILKNTIYYYDNINEYYERDKYIIDKIIDELNIYLDEIKDTQKIRSINFQYLVNDLKSISEKLN